MNQSLSQSNGNPWQDLKGRQVVDVILDSLAREDEKYAITLPAGIGVLQSMLLLNTRANETLGHDVIQPETIAFYRLIKSCDEAAPHIDRRIELIPIVNGSVYENRSGQERILAEQGLTFAEEAHQIILGAAARLKWGIDIFEGFLVRGAFSECAIMTHPACGIRRHEYQVDDRRFYEMAASGEPAARK